MRTIIIISTFLFVCASGIAQSTLNLNTKSIVRESQRTMPTRDIDISSDGITVTYQFESVGLWVDQLFEGATTIGIEGFFQNHAVGKPAYLTRWDTFVVPNDDVKVSVLDSIFVEYPLELSPARPVLPYSGSHIHAKDVVKPVSEYNGLMPFASIPATMRKKYRENHLLEVCVSPVQYDYQKKRIRICKELRYKVCFSNESTERTARIKNGQIFTDDSFLANIALNARYGIMGNSRSASSTQLSDNHYLIITVPKYEEAANRFAEWKSTLGFNVHLDTMSTWTSVDVKSAVKRAYDDYNIRYVLIIGGHNDVPGKLMSYNNISYVTDLYYGCINSEYTPDIYRGRLPVSTLEEANAIIDKIIGYEKNPCTAPSMYSTGVHCALFEDQDEDSIEDTRNILTSERIRDHIMQQGKAVKRIYHAYSNCPKYYNNGLYANGGLLPPDLLDPEFSWVADSMTITDNINQKAFYVLYLGHGDFSKWGAPEYNVDNINSLSNGNALPVIFSLTCITGNFRYPNSFCETFLKKSGGGCVAVYGATTTSYAGQNDVLAEGMFDAIWPSSDLWPALPFAHAIDTLAPTPTFRLGQILDQGLHRVAEAYQTGLEPMKVLVTHEVFHCFGDPSMMIYTDTPTPFSNAAIIRNNGLITVNTGGETATIAFYNRRTGTVESFSGTSQTYTDDPEVSVCISAHNKIPYIDGGTLYIQNKTLSNDDCYEANIIKVGNHVTTTQTLGDVNFIQGHHQLVGKEVELHPGTSVSVGTTLEIRNN